MADTSPSESSSSGCLMLIVLPLLVLGLLGFFAAFRHDAGSEDVWVGLLSGIAFTLAGLGLWFLNWGVELDPERGELRRWATFIVPLSTKTIPLSSFNAVVLDAGKAGGPETKHFQYTVELQGSDTYHVHTGLDYGVALETARRYAQGAKLPLVDRSVEPPTRVSHETLAQSLAERLRAENRGDAPQRPRRSAASSSGFGSRMKVLTVEHGRVYRIPPIGLRTADYLGAGLFGGALLGHYTLITTVGGMADGFFHWGLLGYIGVALATGLVLSPRIRRRFQDRQRVEVDDGTITVSARGQLLRVDVESIQTLHLLDVGERPEGYPPLKTSAAGMIYLGAPSGDIEFGHPLDQPSLHRLYADLLEAIERGASAR